jgi:hypothetical protein
LPTSKGLPSSLVQLVINLRTAKTLVAFQITLLARADEVIE